MAGVNPTTRSTRPKRAEPVATMRSQASASSKAAVSVMECAANTVGNGSCSRARVVASCSAQNDSASSGDI